MKGIKREIYKVDEMIKEFKSEFYNNITTSNSNKSGI